MDEGCEEEIESQALNCSEIISNSDCKEYNNMVD